MLCWIISPVPLRPWHRNLLPRGFARRLQPANGPGKFAAMPRQPGSDKLLHVGRQFDPQTARQMPDDPQRVT